MTDIEILSRVYCEVSSIPQLVSKINELINIVNYQQKKIDSLETSVNTHMDTQKEIFKSTIPQMVMGINK